MFGGHTIYIASGIFGGYTIYIEGYDGRAAVNSISKPSNLQEILKLIPNDF
jgi:hypothetical protein